MGGPRGRAARDQRGARRALLAGGVPAPQAAPLPVCMQAPQAHCAVFLPLCYQLHMPVLHSRPQARASNAKSMQELAAAPLYRQMADRLQARARAGGRRAACFQPTQARGV